MLNFDELASHVTRGKTYPVPSCVLMTRLFVPRISYCDVLVGLGISVLTSSSALPVALGSTLVAALVSALVGTLLYALSLG